MMKQTHNKNKQNTKTAGRASALLILIVLTLAQISSAANPSDHSLAPDYGLENQYVEAPDNEQPLPLDPPQQYQPPELLDSGPDTDIEPPLDVGDEIIIEEGDYRYPHTESTSGNQPEISLDGIGEGPLVSE